MTVAVSLARRGRITIAILITAVILIGVSAIRFSQPAFAGVHKVLTDFDAFHIAGGLAATGRLDEAYDADTFLIEQQRVSGIKSFMPWTYPPPFAAVVQVLSYLPIGLSYALFTGLSFAFYLLVLRRIAGDYLPGVLIAIAPILVINLRTGQNGFLIAGLIGAFLLALMSARKKTAGALLGMLMIKPHLAVSMGLLALWQRSVALLAIAVAVVVALIGAASWLYGFAVWTAFATALRQATGFLELGYYPLFRMSSVYATLFSLGAGPRIAIVGQALCAIAALAVFVLALVKGTTARYRSALACAAAVMFSPYCYDYDLTILGLALAFVIPDILSRAADREVGMAMALGWLVGGYGLAVTIFMEKVLHLGASGVVLKSQTLAPALIAPVLLILCIWIAFTLRRKPRGVSAR